MANGGEREGAAGDETAQFLPADETHPGDGIARLWPATHQGEYRSVSGLLPRLWHSFFNFVSGEIARDAARGAGFLCLPVLMASGAAIYFALPFEPSGIQVALYILVLAAGAYQTRQRPILLAVLSAMLVFTAGVGAAKVETWRNATTLVGSDVTTNITGRLVGSEKQASGRVRLTIKLLRTERPRLYYPPEQVRLTARSVPPDLQPGDGVSGLVRLMSPSGPVRPGSYDFSFTSYFAQRGAVGFFMSGPERVKLDDPPPMHLRPVQWLETVREALAERIRSRISGPKGEVAVAIITGHRQGIPEEINEWLRRAGLAHILAISGLHMALVAFTIMFMVRAVCALFPAFSSRKPVKKYAAAAALAMCTVYLFISGAAVAAQRSYIMLAVMLAALLFDRAALTMRNVAIAALIIIVWSPHEVVGPSFQMSFAATAALVAAYAGWREKQSRSARRVPSQPASHFRRGLRATLLFFAGLAATSIIAGVATTLYGIWHFQRVAPLSLPANLAAMPLVSMFAMPSAVLAMLGLPLGLDGIFLGILGHSINAVTAIARWFADHSPVDAVGLMPVSALLYLTAALVILVVSTTKIRLLAIPLLTAGVVCMAMRQVPDVLVSEDARLVGVHGSDGTLAVNRVRPNGFTMRDWQPALAASSIVKPRKSLQAPTMAAKDAAEDGFSCSDDFCLVRHESGAWIAHAADSEAALTVCDTATLIVLNDATVGNPCKEKAVRVITKRHLARNGSALITFERGAEGLTPHVTYSTPEPWSPWHSHRAWSRAARGLPPN